VFKLVIQIPSVGFIQINEFALHIESSEFQYQMDNLGFVEIFLFGLHICDLDSTLGQIDKPSFGIDTDDLHVILGSNTQMLLHVFNSFPGGVGSENESLPVVVL
jgi:hypothetical protein